MQRQKQRRAPRERKTGPVEATGRVTRIYYSSDSFSAGVLTADDGTDYKFAAKGELETGDRVTLSGEWKYHAKYGSQIDGATFLFDTKPTTEGLVAYLSKSDRFKGVGPSRAAALVNSILALGDFETIVVNTDPAEIAERAGVPVAVVETLRDEWTTQAGTNGIMAELAGFGVTPAAAKKLFDRFGGSVVKTIQRNPYFLVGRIRGYGFKRVDEIALRAGMTKNDSSRIAAGVVHVLREARDNGGHTFTAAKPFVRAALELLALDTIDCRERVEAAIGDAVEGGDIRAAEINGEHLFGLPELWQAEEVVQGAIKANAQVAGAFSEQSPESLAKLALDACSTLNDGQVAAVVGALSNRLSVITGGAGSGKTFLVGAICDLFESHNDATVALAAPTGKAANRLIESVGRKATTIHVLLDPKPQTVDGEVVFNFAKNEEDKIDADLLIVDEVSMVDVLLFSSLLLAVDWNRTTVVLVGDHNQLPPVGAGAVLRDLISGDLAPVARLTEIHRNAGTLERKINNVLSGVVEASVPRDSGSIEIPPWTILPKYKDKDEAATFIARLFREHLEKFTRADGSPVDPIWGVQLLTAMHNGPVGTKALNFALQTIAAERDGRPAPIANPKTGIAPIQTGDKIIQTKNDYKIGVMNGTVGRVVSKSVDSQDMTIDFDGIGVVELSGSAASNVQLAYALTVHKSQGSEYPIVVYVCHKSQSIMLHRGLFYTAVSRAREAVVVVGDSWGIRTCAKRIRTDKRRTLLSLSSK